MRGCAVRTFQNPRNTEHSGKRIAYRVSERSNSHDHYPVEVAATSRAEHNRVQDGPETVSLGCPMASDRRLVPASTRGAARRPAPHPAAAVLGRYFVDPRQRRALARFTRTISLSGHVLAATPRVDRQRRVPQGVEATAGTTRPIKGSQLGRSDRRRLVCTGKKGGAEVGYGRKGKGTTVMLMVDGEGTPLSAFTTSASTSEVHAIETLVDTRTPERVPEQLLYDKAADADWLRERLEVRGIALICPHRA